MTEQTARLSAAVAGLLVFFVAWATVAARPWTASGTSDPRALAIERREQRLASEARRVDRVVQQRFAVYHKRLERRKRAIARRKRENAAVRAAARRAAVAAPAVSAPVAPAAPAVSAPPSVAVTTAPPVTTTSSS
jgi:hypothetical protein